MAESQTRATLGDGFRTPEVEGRLTITHLLLPTPHCFIAVLAEEEKQEEEDEE